MNVFLLATLLNYGLLDVTSLLILSKQKILFSSQFSSPVLLIALITIIHAKPRSHEFQLMIIIQNFPKCLSSFWGEGSPIPQYSNLFKN